MPPVSRIPSSQTPPPDASPLSSPSTVAIIASTLATWLVSIIAVCGLVVLLALGKIDQTAGLALLAGIVGLHGGAQAARS